MFLLVSSLLYFRFGDACYALQCWIQTPGDSVLCPVIVDSAVATVTCSILCPNYTILNSTDLGIHLSWAFFRLERTQNEVIGIIPGCTKYWRVQRCVTSLTFQPWKTEHKSFEHMRSSRLVPTRIVNFTRRLEMYRENRLKEDSIG